MPTVEEVLILDNGGVPDAIACSRPAVTPSAFRGADAASPGVVGCEFMRALPSTESASKSSGGRRSFSISDLRLEQNVVSEGRVTEGGIQRTRPQIR